MITIFIPVLIIDTVLLAIAFGLTKENSKYLLSGYNTMSKKERDNFDIENYLTYLKRFFLLLTTTSTLIFALLILFYSYLVYLRL